MSGFESTIAQINRQEEENGAKLLAQKYQLDYINLVGYPIVWDVLKIIPEDIAKKYLIVAYLKSQKILKVATSNPDNPELKDVFEKIHSATGYEMKLVVCSRTSVAYCIKMYETLHKNIQDAEKMNVQKEEEKSAVTKVKNLAELKDTITSIPATNIMEMIFSGAVSLGASDVHVEPTENDVRIRYRIDGVLQDIVNLPKTVYRILNSRIKYLSKLKLDITSVPQDGRFDIVTADMAIDIRVSIIPSAYGETIVMRLLPKEKEFLTLEQLGFDENAIKIINEAIVKPNGIIFNTGPTGSGKTTTNYAILSKLNQPEVKIITLEDPIEYKIAGINQTQVNEDKGYTFASGLRSVLRQDPDIIMVGEVRDEETATISMQAAMTGHLVLTTLHTNSAATAIPRLLEMDVKPYLLGGTINLIIAQRLVRKIHKECGGKGCTECNNTGYKGRIALVELLVPNKQIEELILRKATVAEFEEVARFSGMKTMYEDGMEKVSQGLTTKEEVLRVTQG